MLNLFSNSLVLIEPTHTHTHKSNIYNKNSLCRLLYVVKRKIKIYCVTFKDKSIKIKYHACVKGDQKCDLVN